MVDAPGEPQTLSDPTGPEDAAPAPNATPEGPAARIPVIVPSVEACRLCPDLPCVAACPEGALVDPGGPRRARLGVAQVDPRHCVTFAGEICTACFKVCPYPNQAISLIGTRPLVSRSSCTGCGLCEHACPEHPKAITVTPERELIPGIRIPKGS